MTTTLMTKRDVYGRHVRIAQEDFDAGTIALPLYTRRGRRVSALPMAERRRRYGSASFIHRENLAQEN